MNRKAIIFGIKGYMVSKAEKNLFKKIKPWGVILFSRNIKNIDQLKNLVSDIKKINNDDKYPIMIDQEGGVVSRLNSIIDFSIFSQEYFGKIYDKNKKLFANYYEIYVNTVCHILNYVGININTVPVLDVKRKNSHNIIGSRSFSNISKKVSVLGKICINNYKKNKIATVIKHIPGHGLSKHDTHYKRSIVDANKKELSKKDFYPFKKSKSLFAMTAHIIYSSYDKLNPATHSKFIIKKIIRNHIGFDGILISDDISMKALDHKLEINTKKALDAGCNLILHCNANIREMRVLGKFVPIIDNFTKKKTSDFYKFLG